MRERLEQTIHKRCLDGHWEYEKVLNIVSPQGNAVKTTFIAHPTEWLKFKKLTIPNVGKDMEQPELSCLVLGRGKGNRPFWETEW